MTSWDMPVKSAPRKRLLTFSSGGWVLLLSFVLTVIAAGTVIWPVYQTGFHRAVGDGKHVDTYGFDLSNLAIPRADLIASGASKDEIRAMIPSLVATISPAQVEQRNINEREQGRFLVSSDRVIGVASGAESRAYPLRVLSFHEVINDVVGGVPIAVTYSPLCDSAAVFDRRIDGTAGGTTGGPGSTGPVEFGVSGLLVDSDLVMFDRRKRPADESLWPQLRLQAISGPELGRRLTVVPFQLTTYKDWVDAHPATSVVEGLPALTQEYKMEPYNTYLASDEVKFPASPLWDNPGIPKKTRIVVTSADGGKTWQTHRAATAAPPIPGQIRLYSFVFAWYAQHPNDTDYGCSCGSPRSAVWRNSGDVRIDGLPDER